jgi:hypothetical protein
VRSWPLIRWLYLALALLLGASVLVYIVGRLTGGLWPDIWMPNFIAEWSGILIAVVLVERLLDRERRRERELALAPLRREAANVLGHALNGVMGFAVATYASSHDITDAEEPVEAAGFVERWAREWPDIQPLRNAEWLQHIARSLERTSQLLRDIRAKYLIALEPNEIVRLDGLELGARNEASTLRTWANALDPNAPSMIGLSAEDVPALVGASCARLAELFRPSAEVYRGMAGEVLTTAGAWGSWSLVRTMTRLASREAESGAG